MANLQDLKKFDLNLLVIFECIYLYRGGSPVPDAVSDKPVVTAAAQPAQ